MPKPDEGIWLANVCDLIYKDYVLEYSFFVQILFLRPITFLWTKLSARENHRKLFYNWADSLKFISDKRTGRYCFFSCSGAEYLFTCTR